MKSHALRIPAGEHTVTVEVIGERARLEVRLARGAGSTPDALTPDTLIPDTLAFEVPARALVAALRASWADVHEPGRTFEPWREDPREPPRRYPYGLDDRPRPGDLGDGDPDGFHDASVVPFPIRYPTRPPRPARSGQPWEPEEEVTARERWLAASPDTDRHRLLAEIAQALERAPGGVAARLPRLGCDLYRPGATLEWQDAPEHSAGD